MNRLSSIEGLRAYLALWVLVGHVQAASGYDENSLSGIPWLLAQNKFAVQVFMMVSGFVIFLLLDNKSESYSQFICRRFLRLYPVFIILFGVSIPISLLRAWDLAHSHQYFSPSVTYFYSHAVDCEWRHWRWNVFWHLTMLHGLVPDPWMNKSTVVAFLGAAWSVSLEWQFYLVAPVAYKWATHSRSIFRIGVCLVCVYLLLGTQFLPLALSAGYLRHGAFLPFSVEFFFVGAVSYFIYRELHQRSWCDCTFPVSVCVAIFIWFLTGSADSAYALIPLYLWLAYLGLLCEGQGSNSTKFLSPIFANPVARYLGRISYSIYLSHEAVMTVAQLPLLFWAPGLSQPAHFGILLVTTTAGTIIVSAFLYRFVEAPGIQLGRRLAERFQKIPANPAAA